MIETDAKAPPSDQPTQDSLILVLSQSGGICSVIEAADSVRDTLASMTEEPSIDQLWPKPLVATIQTSLKRALRERKSHSIEAESDDDGTASEYLFVVQGRDRVMMIVRDLSVQRRALLQAHELAYTDEVTGLPNREFLYRELQEITEVQRLREGRAAVICLQVDRFDDQGYTLNAWQQDDVIEQLAHRLTTNIRGSNGEDVDNFERYSVIARTDFQQFSIVLPSIEGGEDAEAVTERLIAELTKPASVATRTVSVRASGGIALFPQDGTDAAALYENATAAMEDARNDPTATFKFHSGTIRLRTLQRSDLEVELKTALERDDYALNFLPIVAATNGHPVTLEALLRWPETILGTQSTRKIVRVAERTGLIVPIGQWVLRHACHQLGAWRQAGHDSIRVAVNLSPQELFSDRLDERIASILKETDTDPRDLDVELKEHMLFREVQTNFAICRKLKSLGIRIVVDDFGVGTCSLAHLSQSPIDALKIDNTLVSSLETSDRDKAACAAAIAIANELGIHVIAEGVETEYQAEVLRDLGCHYLQGFLISTPMTTTKTLQYLQDVDHGQQTAKGVS